jgi:hypothetical protein
MLRILLLTLLTLAMTNALSPQGQWKAKFQQAKAERFGMRARNAAINCTVGDTIVPLLRNLETRQGLANRGVYAGVEYVRMGKAEECAHHHPHIH